MNDLIDVWNTIVKEDYHVPWGIAALYEGIIATIFAIWFFYKITGFKVKGFKERLFVAFVFIISCSIRIWNIYSIIFVSVVQIALFLLYYRHHNRIKIITTVILASLFNLAEYLLLSLMGYIKSLFAANKEAYYQGMPLVIAIFATVFYLLAGVMVRKTKTLVVERLDGQHRKLFLEVAAYFYVSLFFITIVLIDETQRVSLVVFLLALTIGQVFYGSYLYNSSLKIERDLLKKKEQKQLKEYAASLEKNELQLRKFKHDYQNMLASLKLTAMKGNNQELLDKLNEYSAAQISEKDLWRFNDVNNVDNDLIKSLIISKLNEIHQKNIPYHFECRRQSQLPQNKFWGLAAR